MDDLPKVWNQKTKEYLGLEIKNDSDGLMQDVHWSEGDFGYFPSYLLGTIYDGMFIKAIEKNLGNIDNLLKEGKIKEITNYLIEQIYKNGGAYTSIEIINNLCNSEICVDPIVNYFENKYKEALKVKEELLKELENANKKIKDQILFNIEMYTALIEKDKDKLTTILKTLKKSEKNIDKVDYLYIKSQFFEEEDNKYQKKRAFEG